jgi:hypothetical protein
VTGLKSHTGPYRVIPGDILEFQMPAVLRVISSDLPQWLRPVYGRRDVEPFLARVSPARKMIKELSVPSAKAEKISV